MTGKSFTFTFPEKTAWVVGQSTNPDSSVWVGGLITILVTPGMPLDAGMVDTRCATILKAFLDEGVRSVAIEDAEGPQVQSNILGPKSNALLKAHKVRIVGVDQLAGIAEMRAIQSEAMLKAPQYQKLFQKVEASLEVVAASLPSGNFAELFRLRLSRDVELVSKGAEIRQLFALERRFGRSMPAEARRLLRGVELTEQIEAKDRRTCSEWRFGR
ncbi:MAG: hypothetical protein U0930_04680 [Pirellulales bacterium]